MRKFVTVLFLLFTAAYLSAPAGAYETGKYIDWIIEEFDGNTWRALDADRVEVTNGRHGELESEWSDCRVCTPEFEEYLRDRRGVVYPAIKPDVFSRSVWNIGPRKGSKYRVVLQNRTSCNLAAAVGVDGVNTVTNFSMKGNSRDAAWVIPGDSSIVVSGFQQNVTRAREFYWTDPHNAWSRESENQGRIEISIYFEDGECAENILRQRCPRTRSSARATYPTRSRTATGAGAEIYNPIRTIAFDHLTDTPLEQLTINYSSERFYGDDDRRPVIVDNRTTYYPPRDDYNPYGNNYREEENDSNGYCFTGIGVKVENAPGGGALVTEVFYAGPAWRAGLREGDVILGLDNGNIHGANDVVEKPKASSTGDVTEVRFDRSGLDMSTRLIIGRVCI